MKILIPCPYCNEMLLRDLSDSLLINNFWCDKVGKGFKIHMHLSVECIDEREREEGEKHKDHECEE